MTRSIAPSPSPSAKGYKKVAPTFVRTGISNVITNIDQVATIVNAVLQGKVPPGRQRFGSLPDEQHTWVSADSSTRHRRRGST